jgi:hypothetical protein
MLDFTKYGREWHRRGNTARLTRARGAEFFWKKDNPSLIRLRLSRKR